MKCLNCGKEYEKTNAVHKYCSERCRHRHKDANRKSMLISRRAMCPVCGKVFTGTGITCSKECGTIRQKKKNKEKAIKKFNVRNKERYFYVGGYDDYESDIYVKCKACRRTIHLGKGSMRKNIKDCPECLRIARAKEAHEKDEAKRIAREQDYLRAVIKEAQLHKPCPVCGKIFKAKSKRGKYCSNGCLSKGHTRAKEIRRRHEAKVNGCIDDTISLDLLYVRDRGICHICGKACDLSDYTHKHSKGVNAFVVGKRYPTIDHVVPLSKGGTHQWANVRLAHHSCNSRKGSRTYKAKGNNASKSAHQLALPC